MMGKRRFQRLQLWVQRFSVIVLLSLLSQGEGFGQESDRQPDLLQDQLLSRLATGYEEQRLDAIAQIRMLLPTAPDSFKTSVVSALGNSLRQDISPVVRAMSAGALEVSGDGLAVPALIAALDNEREVAVRKAIIYALARYPQAQVAASLIPILNDKKQELRGTAAYALAEVADPASAPALIEVLQRRRGEEDAFARSQAARGLGRVGSREALEALLHALSKDKSQEVRREAARALGRLATRQDAKVIESLREAAVSDDPYLTLAADIAIASINARSQ